ncbi:MAG: hypothetical protein IKN99_07135 [Bacteroidales bacterium]|nr:hypothetical protein [Bacteroidales bacterium]
MPHSPFHIPHFPKVPWRSIRPTCLLPAGSVACLCSV